MVCLSEEIEIYLVVETLEELRTLETLGIWGARKLRRRGGRQNPRESVYIEHG